jgi:hypothetical protein
LVEAEDAMIVIALIATSWESTPWDLHRSAAHFRPQAEGLRVPGKHMATLTGHALPIASQRIKKESVALARSAPYNEGSGNVLQSSSTGIFDLKLFG